ncbi:MAG: hypothetical protein VX430_02160 [Pseudomonadota bacterium]|nr:hypothetical protein [Pseudomonadota bacterium]
MTLTEHSDYADGHKTALTERPCLLAGKAELIKQLKDGMRDWRNK